MSTSAKHINKAPISYDPLKLGYSVVNDAPDVIQSHKQGGVYFSEDVAAREVEEIFMKEWLLVGRVEEVAKPGDYFTLRIADEPIVLVQEKNGNIQAFANVCRHRGVQVAWDSGNTKYFSCPYHGWVYDTSGKLVDAQYLDKTKNFRKKDCALPRLRTELWEGFIFVNFDNNASPLTDTLDRANFREIYGPYQMGKLKLSHKFSLELPCNWKFLNENLTDIYHIAVLHSETFGPHQPLEDYRYEVFDGGYHGRFRGGTIQPDGQSLFGPMPWLPEELHSGGFSSHLPPNLAWFPRYDFVLFNVNWPLSVDSSYTLAYVLFPEEYFNRPDFAEKSQKYSDFIELILGEDLEMVRSLQRGMKSKYFDPGPSSTFEAGVMQLIKHNIEDLENR